jgi:predicted phosphodiesterase
MVRNAMNPPRAPSDDSPTTLRRGSTIADLAPAIWDYLDRFTGALPSVLIVGHTHVAGQQSLQRTRNGAVDMINVFNTGSWVSGRQIPQPQRHACVVRMDGSVQAGPVP